MFYEIIKYNFDLKGGDFSQNIVSNGDNPLFRQIRLITNDKRYFNRYVVFIDIRNAMSHQEEFDNLLDNGFLLNGYRYLLSERSASMTRQGVISFVRSDIYDELDKRITMEIDFETTVLSKYMAYRGLMFSACHCIEGWYPKIIVVPDYYATIKDQHIKYATDEIVDFIDKDKNSRQWKQKVIKSKIQDIEINAFDGSGICHPQIVDFIQNYLHSNTRPTSFIIRGPFLKGLVTQFDYTLFLKERNIFTIKDLWGKEHSVEEPMIIFTESQYKGIKYFKKYNDYRDWDRYWELFKKYEHCIGITKWNFSKEEEPLYTRGNYQILQDLQLSFEDFCQLSDKSAQWVTKILDEDINYLYLFLGLTHEVHNPMNEYVEAILKNPEMRKEKCVRDYIVSLIEKYLDDLKCGKLWLKATFKFLLPDLIALCEHIGGLPVKGCLEFDEFYSNSIHGNYLGEYVIDRNPHICKSEHVILKGVVNPLIEKYCSHLSNVCMINIKSITPQRLNGADYDGDIVLLIDEPLFLTGINRDCFVVIDIEDKITALSEPVSKENIKSLVKRTMGSKIGEISNYATFYHNKQTTDPGQREKYDTYIDLLSIINGKEIDKAKTGFSYSIPFSISKFARPLPYFMKYRSEYYSKLKLSKTQSNLNRLAWMIEKWERKLRFKRTYKDFDYTIMIDSTIPKNLDTFSKVEQVFLECCDELKEISEDAHKFKNYEKYKDWFDLMYPYLSPEELKFFTFNYNYYYNNYKKRAQSVCPNPCELANYLTELCYVKYPNKNKKLLWKMAGQGIVKNLKQIPVALPVRNEEDGTIEYLGKKYIVEEVTID